ncbi:hypothetical protein HRR83_008845 [Exophiala dermatitidis]|uniref:Uncharacterized protein n=2 Tax=Exophiala dermatitidis TaxID=5970 RepID=H6BXH1_EXODN|nr:uncharacterized protein HMPREF1120_03540 [Exophiala dermatitidis NIH/UT8656]KAJ4503674.1 hypothetical protein HRR73_008979 [Exophiala dermatitidis]EHY55402.1 hypothetical protein HMPREF1120_03540 [Exophiala dermatitidis NIH/UT8656]KAJ4506275.1 hypothetical protein HRR75_007130 [Exophiala dermatitidis]KAJ4508372.1 hypothetical protein HRR74_007771 [Exophiala dermatitidis]KAJ4533408.1 hypothetical protein HRR77_008572 [Exophiala dermatitidis]
MPPPFALLTAAACFLVSMVAAFSGNFELTNLVVSSPFQADPKSTESTYVEFDFCDQDTPDIGSTHCCVQWAVGLNPPVTSGNTCDNTTFAVLVTSWGGVQNLSLELSHTYIDNSVGQAPYNVLTKFADLNLTYPGTNNYECDSAQAECKSCDGEVIVATVSRAVA